MIATTKRKIRSAYISHFNKFWWCAATFLLVLAVGTLGHTVIQVQSTVNNVNQERSERLNVQDQVNAYICKINDEQDKLLAGLLGVLSSAPPKGFGPGVDPIRTRKTFRRAEADLSDKPDCLVLVKELTP